MAQHFFYNIMRKTIVQTLDIFNDIKIAKYNDTGEIEEYISVPLKFAPKSKQWYFQESQRDIDGLTVTDQIFPLMAVQMTGIDFAKDRTVNNLQKIASFNNANSLTEHLTPIPYDYQFTLEVVSKYMIDMIQIMEQILPWFNPHIILRITVPELNIQSHPDNNDPNDLGSEALELKVTYNGVNVEQPTDIDIANVRIIKWNFDFTVKGYLFQPIIEEPAITKIVHEVYGSSISTATSGASGNWLFRDNLMATDIKKYDNDAKILFEIEREDNQ